LNLIIGVHTAWQQQRYGPGRFDYDKEEYKSQPFNRITSYLHSQALATRISSEKTRNHLDFRGRLDGEGARYGKILDFRLRHPRCIFSSSVLHQLILTFESASIA